MVTLGYYLYCLTGLTTDKTDINVGFHQLLCRNSIMANDKDGLNRLSIELGLSYQDLSGFVSRFDKFGECIDVDSGKNIPYNVNPIRAALGAYESTRTHYYKVSRIRKPKSEDFEFLRSIFIISIYFQLLKYAGKDRETILRQFCQLSGVGNSYQDYLSLNYLTPQNGQSSLIEKRGRAVEELLIELTNFSSNWFSELISFSYLEYRSTALEIKIDDFFQWYLVEFFQDEILDQRSYKKFDFWSVPLIMRKEFYLNYCNYQSSKNSDKLRTAIIEAWYNKILKVGDIYFLDLKGSTVTSANTGKKIKLTPLEINFIKAVYRKPASNIELVTDLSSTEGSVKKYKSTINKKFLSNFGEELIGTENQKNARAILNIISPNLKIK